MRSKRDKPAAAVARGAATYPLSDRSRVSSACCSGTSVNCSVSGPPGTRSPFTIVVWPTFAHSARICLSVASFATSDTRPF